MIYAISNDELTVSISDMGAEVVSVIHKGRQRVWQNDNGTWFGHSPVLFPVCGNNAVVIDGKDYNMPFHGFARKSVFSVVKNMSDSITPVLMNARRCAVASTQAFRLQDVRRSSSMMPILMVY